MQRRDGVGCWFVSRVLWRVFAEWVLGGACSLGGLLVMKAR